MLATFIPRALARGHCTESFTPQGVNHYTHLPNLHNPSPQKVPKPLPTGRHPQVVFHPLPSPPSFISPLSLSVFPLLLSLLSPTSSSCYISPQLLSGVRLGSSHYINLTPLLTREQLTPNKLSKPPRLVITVGFRPPFHHV